MARKNADPAARKKRARLKAKMSCVGKSRPRDGNGTSMAGAALAAAVAATFRRG